MFYGALVGYWCVSCLFEHPIAINPCNYMYRSLHSYIHVTPIHESLNETFLHVYRLPVHIYFILSLKLFFKLCTCM